MSRFIPLIITLFLLSIFHASAQSLLINEIMSSNLSSVADEDGDFEDWIELKNTGDTPVDLTGYGLSDNDNQPFKWVFPSGTIQPQGYVFIWASGKNKPGISPDWQEVFPFESEWNYYDRAQAPPSGWNNIGFDDSNWEVGTGMFGYGRDYLGYGTVLDYGGNPDNKHISYYFRKKFSIVDYPENAILRFRLKVDDGAVVYINGTEVDRFHMPDGEIGHQTRANEVVNIYEVVDFFTTADMLVTGDNIIAVSVHQNNRHSSDVAFDLRLDWSVPAYHTNFSISSSGEEILLTSPEGNLIDRIPPVFIPTDISYGRKRHQTEELVWFDQPTPNRPNSETFFAGISPAPIFSRSGGFYTSAFELEISSNDPDIVIYYTLDGSIPKTSRLEGEIYPFKNQYQQHPNSDPGEFLYDSIITLRYDQAFLISDRTPEINKTSQKSSSWDRDPHYLPVFPISKGNIVKAIAVREGYLPSEVITETFFVFPEGRNRYSLPVISLSVDENHLFDFFNGIYNAGVDFENWRTLNPGSPLAGGGYPANWQRSDEYPLYFQYFDAGEDFSAINQQIGFRIHGGWSRARRIKSLRLYARNSYESPGELNYPFLKDNLNIFGEPVRDYKRLLLRAGGNDNNFLHDALKHRIMSPAQLDMQTVQPAVHFINGEYWGLTNIRERIDRYFIASRYGIDPDNIIMLNAPWGQGHPSMVQEGEPEDILLFRDYFNFLLNNDVRKEEIYDYVKNFKDILGYIDYNLMFIYLNNSDWGGWKHYRYWRVRDTGAAPYEDGRWRFIIWDFDAPRPPDFDMLAQFLDPQGNGIVWETNFILRKLLENTDFKNLFVNRLADHINTTFQPHRIESLLNELAGEIIPEMDEHFDRWRHPAFSSGEINYFTDFAERRPEIMRDQLRHHLQVGEDIPISLNVSNPEMGYIKINTIKLLAETAGIMDAVYPWQGIYLSKIPIELEAIPFEGFEFSHWEGLASPELARQTVTLESALAATAHFYSTGRPEPEIIYYWVFDNDLPNNTPLTSVLPRFSLGEFAEINYRSSLAGYPFSSGHPLWRRASMERRNQPTALNYFPEVNNGIEFANSNMRGLQIKQPFEGNAGKNQMNIDFSTVGFRNIEIALAVTDENAADALVINLEKLNSSGIWEKINIPADTFYISSAYLLYHKDLSRVEEINDLEKVRVNINFIVEDPIADNGDRVTFNNISISAYPFDKNGPGILPINPLPDLHLIAGQDMHVVNLQDYFRHEGDNPINFEIIVDRDIVAEINSKRSELTIFPENPGEVNIIIKAYDWLSPELIDSFTVVVHPTAVELRHGEFYFGQWGTDKKFMEFPDRMLFIEYSGLNENESQEKAYPHRYFPGEIIFPYETNQGNAISALEDEGLSISVDANREFAVLLALDTRETKNIHLTFTAQKIAHGAELQMFYRTEAGGDLIPLSIQGNQVNYRPGEFESGEKVYFFQLPEYLSEKEYLQLIWKVKKVENLAVGEVAELRIDDIYVFSQEDKEVADCFNLFPNPVADQLYFYTQVNISIEIISDKGAIIRQFQTGSGIQSTSLADIPSGVYLLTIRNSEGYCNQKFIKY